MKIIIPKNLKFLCEISSLKLDEKVQHEVGGLCQNLKSIIGPAPKLHDTGLLVKGEVFNIHLKNCNYFGFTTFVRRLHHKLKYQKLRYWFHRNFSSVYSLFMLNLLGTSIKSIKIFYVVKLFNIRLGKIHQPTSS